MKKIGGLSMGKINNLFFSFLFSAVIILFFFDLLTSGLFYVGNNSNIWTDYNAFHDFYQVVGRVTRIISIITLPILMIVVYKFFIHKPLYSKYIYGMLTGFFIGHGVHWVYHTVITTLSEIMSTTVLGYLLMYLGLARIIITVAMVVIMIRIYPKVADKLNIRLYLATVSVAYCLMPFVVIMSIIEVVDFRLSSVVLLNAPLLFLFVGRKIINN
jgi:hypothetical protein